MRALCLLPVHCSLAVQLSFSSVLFTSAIRPARADKSKDELEQDHEEEEQPQEAAAPQTQAASDSGGPTGADSDNLVDAGAGAVVEDAHHHQHHQPVHATASLEGQQQQTAGASRVVNKKYSVPAATVQASGSGARKSSPDKQQAQNSIAGGSYASRVGDILSPLHVRYILLYV